MNDWQAYFFGSFRLIAPKNEPINLGSPTIRSLIAYLVLNRDQQIDRRQLAYMFWPRGTETAARRNLRQYLHRIRKLTSPSINDLPLVISTSNAVQFNPEILISSDIHKFLQLSGHDPSIEDLIECANLFTGEFLEDVYEDWVVDAREEYNQRGFQVLESLRRKLQNLGRYSEAIEYALKQIKLEPYNEIIHRNLISLYFQNQERNKSLLHYKELVNLLDEDLGIEPLPETADLYEAIQKGQFQIDLSAPQKKKESTSIQRLDQSIPLIGREEELSKLDQIINKVRDHHGSFLLITGESGIGKTRLVQEFLSRQNNLKVINVVCHELDINSPYTPIREMLERAIPLLPEEKKVSPEIILSAISIAPVLKTKYPLASNDQKPLQMSYPDALLNLFEQAVAQKNLDYLIINIDNLHWSDTLSWNIIVQFARKILDLPIMLIGICRNEDLMVDRQQLIKTYQRNLLVEEIALPRLNSNQTKQIAENILSAAHLNEEFYNQLHNETEGIPLFIIEMLKSQKESGEPLGIKASPIQQGLPPGIRQVIDSRLDRLPPKCRDVLASAAVVGREFTFSFLEEINDLPSEDLVMYLEEIGNRGLIREVDQGFDFSHEKIRQVAYQNLSKARRQYYHRRVADALERAIPPASPATLAYHHSNSDNPVKALPYFISAGEDALRSRSYLEAHQIGNQAVNLLARVPGPEKRGERIDLNLQLAQAYAFSGDFKQAMEVMNYSEHIAARMNDQTRQGQIFYRSSQIYWQIGEPITAGDYARRALRIADELHDDQLLAAVLRMLGRVGIALAAYDDAIAHLHRYLHQAKLMSPQPPINSVLGYLGVAYGRVGSWRTAFEMAEQGVGLARQEGILETINFAKMQLAFVHGDYQEWEQSLALVNEVITTNRIDEVLTPAHFILLSLKGRALGFLGEHEEGINAIQSAIDWAERTDYRLFYYLPKLFLIECLMEAGKVDQAIKIGEQTLLLTQTSNNPWALGMTNKLLAQAHTFANQPDYPKVEEHLINARNLMRQVRSRPDLARTYLALRKLYDRAGQIAWAVDCHFRATSIFEECGMSNELSRAQGIASRERTGAVVIPNLNLKGPNQGEDYRI